LDLLSPSAEEYYQSDSLINREICYLFLLYSNSPLMSYHVQVEEVTGLFKLEISQLAKLLTQEIFSLQGTGFVLSADALPIGRELSLQKADLVPHTQEYWRKVLSRALNF